VKAAGCHLDDHFSLALSVGVLFIGIVTIIFVVILEPYNRHDEMLVVNIVFQIMNMLFIMVPIFVIVGLVIWLCKGCPSLAVPVGRTKRRLARRRRGRESCRPDEDE
jgi:hypothetical protein